MVSDSLGWIGATCLAICAAPQAYKSFKEKHSRGISIYTLLLWLTGEICTLIYLIPKKDLPLIANYTLNLIFIGIIFYYKCKPQNQNY